jgi:transposase
MTLTSALEENKQLKQEIIFLRQQLDYFKKNIFGCGKNEKLDKNQLALGLAETAEKEPEVVTEKISYERKVRKVQKSKEESYEHIPVGKTVVLIPDEVKENPSAYEEIGKESTFELAISVPKLYRIEYIHKNIV